MHFKQRRGWVAIFEHARKCKLLDLEQEFHWIGTAHHNEHNHVRPVHYGYPLGPRAYNILMMAEAAHTALTARIL
jgi:hypothetical protein